MAKGGGFESLDIISNLSVEVVNEILIRLELRDAVRTSILSTKWRYKWTSMPELDFTRSHFPLSIRSQDDDELAKIVTDVLFLHDAKISKFELLHFLKCGCPDVGRWIVILSRKKVHHLVLAFYKKFVSYQVPGCLFTCESLRSLRLKKCIISLPSRYKGFNHLTSLELEYVNITNGAFESLVAKIPLLETLRVADCESLTRFHVHHPNLAMFHIKGICESINLRNIPNLINVRLEIKLPGTYTGRGLDKILHGLNQLQVVHICYPYIESIPVDIAPERLHTTYHHLTDLSFEVNMEDTEQILAILFLYRSSPCLEKLFFYVTRDGSSTLLYDEQFWDARSLEEDNFCRLKKLTLWGFMGSDAELRFTEFILLNAELLETLRIRWYEDDLDDNKKLKRVQQMMQFRRASTKARVTFDS